MRQFENDFVTKVMKVAFKGDGKQNTGLVCYVIYVYKTVCIFFYLICFVFSFQSFQTMNRQSKSTVLESSENQSPIDNSQPTDLTHTPKSTASSDSSQARGLTPISNSTAQSNRTTESTPANPTLAPLYVSPPYLDQNYSYYNHPYYNQPYSSFERFG